MEKNEQRTEPTRLEVIKNFLENRNYEIVYWDTDCILIKYKDNDDEESLYPKVLKLENDERYLLHYLEMAETALSMGLKEYYIDYIRLGIKLIIEHFYDKSETTGSELDCLLVAHNITLLLENAGLIKYE